MDAEENYYKYILMFLATFGLMFSYYYFAPVVFLSIFIHILYLTKAEGEKIISAKSIVKILISLVIPGLFGVMYFIVFQQIKNGANMLQEYTCGINTAGPIYNNLITTMFIFVVLSIYYIIKSIKDKKSNLINKMLIISLIFISIIFIGMKLGKVSEYYFYKLYYMLWIYVIVVAFKAIELIITKKKLLVYIGITLYFIGIIIAIVFNKNIIFFDIYKENFEEIKSEYIIISENEMEIFEYYNTNIDNAENLDDSTYLYVGGNVRPRWIYALTKNLFLFIDVSWGEIFTDIQQFLDSEKQYCIIFKLENKEIYENIENIKDVKILFKNEDGVIIEKY